MNLLNQSKYFISGAKIYHLAVTTSGGIFTCAKIQKENSQKFLSKGELPQ